MANSDELRQHAQQLLPKIYYYQDFTGAYFPRMSIADAAHFGLCDEEAIWYTYEAKDFYFGTRNGKPLRWTCRGSVYLDGECFSDKQPDYPTVTIDDWHRCRTYYTRKLAECEKEYQPYARVEELKKTWKL